jgi:D-alanyl-D-alanine carboxypeptidase (penicillin-binding protein 5/6)
MTMELVFRSIRTGEHSLNDMIHISENAWRTGGSSSGGSTMFAKLDSDIRLDDLIHAVIVQSANDACIAIAEAYSGSEELFAKAMTERARAIGLMRSEFKNSTGLPAPGQRVTMRDLANLGRHIWKEYPDFYPIYSQREFEWNKIKQRNRNPLLAMDIGADGMKTGFTEESGYAIVGSSTRNGRRLFMALSGMATERERSEEGRKMLEWGMRAFEKRDLFKEGEPVGEAAVFGGVKSSVPLVAKGVMSIFVPVASRDQLKARIVYQGPLAAPVEQGAEVGKLRVFIGERLMQETPVFAGETVETGNIRRRAEDALYELMTGWFRTL